MTTVNIIMAITMAAYLLSMILIGVLCSKRSSNSSGDYFLGGRKLGPVVTAMSAEASDMSSWLLMGIPGLVLFTGLAEATWTILGLAIGTYLNFLFVAKRLRIYSEKINAITVPEFISKRLGDDKNILRFIAALIIVIFFVPYTASGFSAIGKLFNSLFGFDYLTTMIVGAVVVILYTILGGFLAVSITDLIQSIVMTLALITVVFFGVKTVGGLNVVADNANSVTNYLSLTNAANVETNVSSPYGFLTILSTLSWGLGYFGMPHILVRFMGISDPKKLKVSRRIGTTWVVISMAIAAFIGIIGFSAMKGGVFNTIFHSASEAESVLVYFAKLLAENSWILAIVGGLILAGILASTMSTSDSQLLAASSSVSEDIICGFFKINVSNKIKLWIARLSIIAISAIAVVIAINPDSSVFKIVSFAWGGFGASFAPVILCSLFWKRTNKWGALAGMLTGAATVFIWKFLLRPLGGLWDIYELLPAFIIALIFIVVVSLLTEKPDEELVTVFDEVKKDCKN